MNLNENTHDCQALRHPAFNHAWHFLIGHVFSTLKALHGAITTLENWTLALHWRVVSGHLAAPKGGNRG